MANRKGNNKRKDNKFFKGKPRKGDLNTELEAFGGTSGGKNDFSWYSRNPLLLQATARVPFPYRPGMSLDLHVNQAKTGGGGLNTITKFPIPGICALDYCMSVGWSDSVTSPASLVSKEMYARIRKSFSGSLACDAPDLFMYIMALDSIYNQIAEYKRVIRIINTFSPENYLVPETLLSVLCPTAPSTEQILQDKVKAFGYANELVGMVNKFYAPGNMDIFRRHYWLGDNVYMDDVSLNSQWYVFRNLYHYEIRISGDYTNLSAVKFEYNSTPTSYLDNGYMAQWYTHIRGLIEKLANSEDAYTINGYFERAYEGVPGFKIEPIGLDELFLPVYDQQVLSQIENSITVSVDPASLKVTQVASTNAIDSRPKTQSASTSDVYTTTEIGSPILNLRMDNPDVIAVVEASRLHPGIRDLSSPGSHSNKFSIFPATEIVSRYTIYNGVNNFSVSAPAGTLEFDSSNIALDTVVRFTQNLCTLSAFDWFPVLNWYDVKTNTMSIFGDIHNVTNLGIDDLGNLNRVCLFSLFDVFSQQ